MKVRCVNRVTLIGNVTRQPDVRSTGDGVSVCNFSIITDRSWVTSTGEKQEESMRHNCVAWNRLAEICGDILRQGTLVFIEGSLQSRLVTARNYPDVQYEEMQVLVDEMIVLNQKGV